jgi:hypothetical protein
VKLLLEFLSEGPRGNGGVALVCRSPDPLEENQHRAPILPSNAVKRAQRLVRALVVYGDCGFEVTGFSRTQS